MPSTRPAPAFLPRALPAPNKGMAHDYRLMVEAVQSGDLIGARKAYGRMTERLIGADADDTLAKIGASLRSGDLDAAHRTLDRVEREALRVLRDLRAHADFAVPGIVLQRSALHRPN